MKKSVMIGIFSAVVVFGGCGGSDMPKCDDSDVLKQVEHDIVKQRITDVEELMKEVGVKSSKISTQKSDEKEKSIECKAHVDISISEEGAKKIHRQDMKAFDEDIQSIVNDLSGESREKFLNEIQKQRAELEKTLQKIINSPESGYIYYKAKRADDGRLSVFVQTELHDK